MQQLIANECRAHVAPHIADLACLRQRSSVAESLEPQVRPPGSSFADDSTTGQHAAPVAAHLATPSNVSALLDPSDWQSLASPASSLVVSIRFSPSQSLNMEQSGELENEVCRQHDRSCKRFSVLELPRLIFVPGGPFVSNPFRLSKSIQSLFFTQDKDVISDYVTARFSADIYHQSLHFDRLAALAFYRPA